jgi:WD40 repeat protein
LVSSGHEKAVKLWSVKSQKEVTTLQGYSLDVHSIAFSPDGKYLASGSRDNTVKVWSIQNFKEI